MCQVSTNCHKQAATNLGLICSAANRVNSLQESIANDSKTSDNDQKSTADDGSFNTAKSAATSIHDFNNFIPYI